MPTPQKPDDPFADQREWLNNRYNPGYFLGGTLRPELRLSLGRRAKRVAGVLALASGVGVLGIGVGVMASTGIFVPDPWSLFVGPLSVLVGIKMWRSARAVPPPADPIAQPTGDPTTDPEIADQARNIGPIVGMVIVATLAAGIVIAGALGILAALTAVSRGAVHGVAAACVLLLFALSMRGRKSDGESDPEDPGRSE
jgi:hypothetical protein